MIIIAGYELVNAKDRNKHVDAFRDLVSRAREFDGCVYVAITADSVDPEDRRSLNVRGVTLEAGAQLASWCTQVARGRDRR
jgi:hypothetical protein